jgi:hypothetical protein
MMLFRLKQDLSHVQAAEPKFITGLIIAKTNASPQGKRP